MPAIEVNGVGKTFEIPHDRQTSLKERFLHPFHRTTYEKNEALKDVTFSVDHGECFGDHRPERKRQEHAAEDDRRHPPAGPRQRRRSTA